MVTIRPSRRGSWLWRRITVDRILGRGCVLAYTPGSEAGPAGQQGRLSLRITGLASRASFDVPVGGDDGVAALRVVQVPVPTNMLRGLTLDSSSTGLESWFQFVRRDGSAVSGWIPAGYVTEFAGPPAREQGIWWDWREMTALCASAGITIERSQTQPVQRSGRRFGGMIADPCFRLYMARGLGGVAAAGVYIGLSAAVLHIWQIEWGVVMGIGMILLVGFSIWSGATFYGGSM